MGRGVYYQGEGGKDKRKGLSLMEKGKGGGALKRQEEGFISHGEGEGSRGIKKTGGRVHLSWRRGREEGH